MEDQVELLSETSNSQEELDTPTIYQCADCSALLGDSTSCVWASETKDVIALEHVNSAAVAVVGDVYTSSEGIDEGSTYRSTRCDICKSTLGSYYMATTRAVDHLREKYTFDGSSIKRYVLGTFGRKSAAADTSLSSLDVRKVQGMTVYLDQRLKRVEKILNIEPNEDDETQYNELTSTVIQNEKNDSYSGKRKAERDSFEKSKRPKP